MAHRAVQAQRLVALFVLGWLLFTFPLLAVFDVPREVLPEIRASGSHFGEAELFGRTLPSPLSTHVIRPADGAFSLTMFTGPPPSMMSIEAPASAPESASYVREVMPTRPCVVVKKTRVGSSVMPPG